MSAAVRTASSASIVPLVSMSSTSLSRSVRCSTRADSTSYATRRTGQNDASSMSWPIGARFLVRTATRGGRLVAEAALDLQAHVERRVLGEVADHVVGIDDLDVVVDLDVAGRDDARALLGEDRVVWSTLCMRIATSLRLSRTSITSSCRPSTVVYSCSTPSISTSVIGEAGDRGQQHAPQRIAERMAEATLQRLDHDAWRGWSRVRSMSMPRGRSTWMAETAIGRLSSVDYFEYSSTIRASLMSEGRSARSGTDLKMPVEFLGVDFDPAGNQVHLLARASALPARAAGLRRAR